METSPFNRLPAELRTRIYEHVFTFDSVRCQDGRWRVYEKRKISRLATRLGPTLVCKQMRAETLHLLMALNEPVCGNEDKDVDPYYEFWMGPRLLIEPCSWASRALDQGRSPFLSHATTFRLHLWVYPCMAGDWGEFEDAFAGLLVDGSPGKMVVTLHFYVDYQPLGCKYAQQQGREGLPAAGSRLEYGAFEMGLDGCGLGNEGLLKLFDEKREGLSKHEGHDRSLCKRERFSEQLDQTEELLVEMAQVAFKRIEQLSPTMSV